MAKRRRLDYDQILPNLYVGRHLNTTSAYWTKEKSGLSAVLSLQTDADLSKHKVNMEFLQRLYDYMGVEFRRCPITDFSVGNLRERLRQCVDVLKELLDAGHTVYIVEDGIAHIREVTPGIQQGFQTEITSGLNFGDNLIIVGQKQIADGQLVHVVRTVTDPEQARL